MLVISGTIRLDPKDRAGAIAAATEMMRHSNAEAGCHTYVFSADLEDEGLFRIFEEWESEEALGAHFKSPHMAAFQKALGGLAIRETKIDRYEVSAKSKLM